MLRNLILGLFLCLATSARATAHRPNILFLFADDQRADTIAALGNRIVKTPNLDRLVRRGVSFDRAYMQGGMEGATCTPSRAMLLSGRSLFRIDENLIRDKTWPESFADAGYATFISGKWHNGQASLPKCFPVTGRVFTGGMALNPLKAPLRTVVDGKVTAPTLSKRHACAIFADDTIRFLKERALQPDRPFFTYLPFDAPHDPHIVPDDFPVHYDPAQIPLPPNFLPEHPWDNGEMTVRDERLLPRPRDPQKIRQMLADYYRYITYLDSLIGRVLDALDASPFAKNTYVVFSADSGVARGSHGLIGKQNLYEHSLRVPLIIAGPGVPEGRRTRAMCYLFDVLPTLGKFCRVPGPPTSDGINLASVLRAPSRRARSEMFFAYKDVQRAVRDDRWKLIVYPKVGKTQLFDLEKDPQETMNLADRPEMAGRIASMTRLLEREKLKFGDGPDAAWIPFRPD